MEYGNEIEQLIQNTFNNFEADVSPDAWVNIQSGLNIQPASNPGSAGNNISTGTKLVKVSSKFSAGGIIGTAAAIIGITASAIYFASDKKEAAVNNTVKESKTIQNTLPPASIDGGSKGFVAGENEKKTEQAPSSLKQEVDTKKETLSGNKTAYYSSTNEDLPVSAMNKKDVTEVAEEKGRIEEAKQPENKLQPAIAGIIQKSSNENSSSDDFSSSGDGEPEIKSEVPEAMEEKSIEEYLGNITNVITPNGDGKDDVFFIEGKDLLNLKVSIIEQATGKTVHHWNNLHGFWDGKLENGQPAKEGLYFYDIFAQPNKGKPIIKKGTFKLILK